MHLTFDHNFSKFGPSFKLLSLTDPKETVYISISGSATSP